MGVDKINELVDAAQQTILYAELALHIAKRANDVMMIRVLEFKIEQNKNEIDFLQQLIKDYDFKQNLNIN